MRRAILLILCGLLVVSGCSRPHERSELKLDKEAARTLQVDQVFERYQTVRNAAIKLLDPKPLSTVESDAVFDIDAGSFEVSQRLAQKQKQDKTAIDVTKVLTPHFSKYPLWFLAVIRDRAEGVNRIQIFERAAAADPWLLVASPETVAETTLPELRTTGDGVLPVKPDNAKGMSMSAQDAASAYATALTDPSSPKNKAIVKDSFIRQMRAARKANSGLQGVTFSQAWNAESVRFALRTADGGALVFVTLLRYDTYKVKAGLTVSWPAGTPQQAFLSSGISGAGTLQYKHQLLVYIPGGDEKPRAIGQYGGVVAAIQP